MKTRSTILATVIALSFAASGVVSANATDSSVGYSDFVQQTAFAEGIIEHTAFVEGIVQNSSAWMPLTTVIIFNKPSFSLTISNGTVLTDLRY